MENKSDNPGWRLYRILDRSLAGRHLDLRRFWAATFDVPPNETRVIFRLLVQLGDLVDEVETLVRKMPNINHDFYLHNLPSLRAALSIGNLEQSAESVVKIFEGGLIRDVGFWAQQIESFGFAPELEADTLRELLSEFDALFDSVRRAEIDEQMKATVLDGLEGLQRVIKEYWLHGSDGLRDELDRFIVKLGRYAPDLKSHSKEDWFARTFLFLSKIDSAVQRSKRYFPLIKPLARLLGVDLDVPSLLE